MSAVTSPSFARLRHNETYCVRTLAELADRTDAGSVRRRIQILSQLDQIRANIRGRCSDCGLPIPTR